MKIFYKITLIVCSIFIAFESKSAPPLVAEVFNAKIMHCEQLIACQSEASENNNACIANKENSNIPALVLLQVKNKKIVSLVREENMATCRAKKNTLLKFAKYVSDKPRKLGIKDELIIPTYILIE
jgi:hypothetical protein